MGTWTPVPIPDGGLVKPSGVNANNTTLASTVNALDTTNVACKYASCDVTLEFREGDTKASFIPPEADDAWFVRGWAIEQQNFAGIETATLALQVITDAGSLVGTLDTSPAQTAASVLTRINTTNATLTKFQGVRVAVTAGAIPAGAGKRVVVTVHTARVLRKSTEL